MVGNGSLSKKLEEEAILKYSYKERVKITKGFYKGFVGVIDGWEKSEETIVYKVKLETENKSIEVSEQGLRRTNLFGW